MSKATTNSSEELTEKYLDNRKKVNFTGKQENNNNNSNNTNNNSSSPSSCDDDNDDIDTYSNASYMRTTQVNATSSNSNSNNVNISRKWKKRAVWEVIEGYRDPNMKVAKPQNYEGILLKRRNWPMKGWHKRYFILADGILTYGKSKADLTKNKDKPHGILNAFLSIVSYIPSKRRILIDSSTQSSAVVCHLKARTQAEFDQWLELLKQHRLYYQFKWSQSTQMNLKSGNSIFMSSPNSNVGSALQEAANLINNANSTANSSSQTQFLTNSVDMAINNENNSVMMGNQMSVKSKKKSTPAIVLDEKGLENHFKRVEESLVNLSKVLSSVYIANISSNSPSISNQQLNNSSFNLTVPQQQQQQTLLQPQQASQSFSHHQHQPSSSSFDYIMSQQNNNNNNSNTLNLSTRIHASKSNPNLMNNELQMMGNNSMINQSNSNATGSPQTNTTNLNNSSTTNPTSTNTNITNTTNPTNNNNNTNHNNNNNNNNNNGSNVLNQLANQSTATTTNIIASMAMANSNLNSSFSGASTTIGTQASSATVTPNIVLSSALSSSLTSSAKTVSKSTPPNDDKNNFYETAKSINDELIFIYQQLLFKKQNLVAAANQSNIENSLERAHRSQSVISSVSLQDSQLQFYDAIEYFTSDTESDDDSEMDSDAEQSAEQANKSQKPAIVPEYHRNTSYDQSEEELQSQKILTRRRKLPTTCPDASQVSIWGIMRKAIGKDLSKISLPVILNEPLSILQRLCEELEYSDLIDSASNTQDPLDRMVYVAAFVISSYSSSYYRSGAKNFNPILGETYELIRPDKGWKYVAEQVSHHPPVSTCHCSSKNFIHEQVFHAKIKFWGKSMEIHPEGYTRLTLPKFNETYQWNKIVMYVHNIMGTARKIEHYGEINIRCTNGVSCTITFPKSNNSSQKNEFYGDVIYDNVVKRKIFGQWHESFLCGTDNTAKTIWRMGAMPEDSYLYYGFTRFAIELNEITEDLSDVLPRTDARYRPDQRALENGDVEKAELEKHRIEEMQRNRRKELETRGDQHQPLWFTQSKDQSFTTNNKEEKEWIFNNQYWSKRDTPGFKTIKNQLPNLW